MAQVIDNFPYSLGGFGRQAAAPNKIMDQKTKEKIERFKGLDFCEHGNQRIYCPECMWDVPAIFRKEREKFLKKQAGA